MKLPKQAAKSKLGRPHSSSYPIKAEHVASLTPHILMMSEQSIEQFAQLSTTLEASISLDTAVAPESVEDIVETFAPAEQIDAMQRSLKAEMRRQVKALGESVKAIHACATELQHGRYHWPPVPPRSK